VRIAIVTDAYRPQTNGVVTTLQATERSLVEMGHEVLMLTPQERWSVPWPGEKDIRLALIGSRRLASEIESFNPDALHIATEGPMGLAARRAALLRGWRFTTSYHTQFPSYLRARYGMPEGLTYAWLRRFHKVAARTLVATLHVRRELKARGFRRLVHWGRGVDTELFQPDPHKPLRSSPRLISVGRVALEKNLERFCELPFPDKWVVGDGPQLATLKARYPDVTFTGFLYGSELARVLAAADCFVFPSLTDTFGVVQLEAMAAGLPVAAYPVTGPLDVIQDGVTGAMNTNLQVAVERALRLNPADCRAYALQSSWLEATRQMLGHFVELKSGQRFYARRSSLCRIGLLNSSRLGGH